MSKIHEVIPKIMAEVGSISKGRKNQQQNYMFRGIDDAYAAFQPLFAKHGVFVVPSVLKSVREERAAKSGGVLIYTTLDVKHTFFADDGSSLECVTVGEAMDSGDKSSNKAMSAAMKYALLEVFCVPTEADNDTENGSPEPIPRHNVAGAAANERSTPAAPAAPPEKPQSDGGASGNDWRKFRVPFGKNKDRELGELSTKSLLWYIEEVKVESSYVKDGKTIAKKPETIAKDQAFRDALDAAYEELVTTGEIDELPK